MFRQHAVHSPESDLLCAPHEIVIRSERAGDVSIVQLTGELDKDSAPAFEAELKRVEATDVRQIVVDLSGLTFIGSDGLKVFIHANARLRDTNRLLLVRGNDEVHGTFEVSGLVSRLPFDDPGGPQREPPAVPCAAPVGTHIVVSSPVHAWPRGIR